MSNKVTKRTVCNRDCPDACSILVDVEDGRAVALRGDPQDPVTKGFLCERTSKFLDRQYAEDRFTSPMLRVDGELQPISWDEALDLAASHLLRIRETYGGAAILDYRSGGSLGMLTRLPSHLLQMFGPVTTKVGDICSGAGEAAQVTDMGISESHDFFDALNSKCVVIWGKDIHTSSVHLLPVLKKVQAQGGRLVGLDVRETKLGALCDDFAIVRPGHDFDLAMALARYLFDVDGVDPSAQDYCDNFDAYCELVHTKTFEEWCAGAAMDPEWVKSLGERFAASEPVSIQVGWGMGRRRFGSATVRAVDALCAISGNIGIPGGGVHFFFGRSSAFDTEFGLDLPEPARLMKESLLGQEILDAVNPKIHMAWITAGNPVSMLPDSLTVREALSGLEFLVVVDTHPTDTTDIADLVLPTTTLLEDDDIMGAFGNHYLRASVPALEAPEGVWHEFKIVQELANRIGLGDTFAGSVRDWKLKVTRRIRDSGLTIEDLEERPCLNPERKPVLFEGRKFPTESGRFQLLTEGPKQQTKDAEYPLELLASSSPKAQSSQWSVDPRGLTDCVLVHPKAAAGLNDGDQAMLESRRSSIQVRVRLNENQHEDVVWMPKGGMFRYGACPNALIRAEETDAGGGAAYYDERVRLLPIT